MAKCRNALVVCFIVLKLITPSLSRLRRVFKIKKSNMRTAIAILAISSCCITLLMYYYSRTLSLTGKLEYQERIATTEPANVGLPMKHISLKEIYDQLDKKNSEEDFLAEDYKAPLLIDNPGCLIPLFAVNYTKNLNKSKNRNCGERAILLKRVDERSVSVSMEKNRLKKYMARSPAFQCCYRFIHMGDNPTKLRYGVCKKLNNGMTIILETEFINVKCFKNGIKHPNSRALYTDMFAFTKKVDNTKLPTNNCKDKYNILMLGIDSMSLPRLAQTMKRTINFFRDNFWLAFRGYHKVGDNTFPNLMAAFTGKNLSVLDDNCSGKMDECNHLLIWSKFKEAGYVTAYGEDYVKLPDTFHDDYLFLRSPTDHYLRPLFLMGETESSYSTVCTGKQFSSQHLLDFAIDFTITYRQQPFFGFFWINSFSHNPNSRPQDGDILIENFLNRLSYTGVLKDTFVILFSDHGIRFGEYRMPMESYYDERLPFLFIWSPLKFKAKHPTAFKNLAQNQFKLVTPYDLHNTLMDINRLSVCNDNFNNMNVSEACPNCHSLFLAVSANRTCQDVAIHEKWCSCHKLYPLDTADPEGIKSTMHVVSYIKSKVKKVKTERKKRCWVCRDLSLKKVLRIHFYYDANKVNLYHVVAFTMTPGGLSYEATVLRKGTSAEIVGKVSFISPYKGLGRCTANRADRLFCVCQEKKNCTIESYEYKMTNK